MPRHDRHTHQHEGDTKCHDMTAQPYDPAAAHATACGYASNAESKSRKHDEHHTRRQTRAARRRERRNRHHPGGYPTNVRSIRCLQTPGRNPLSPPTRKPPWGVA